MTMTMTTATTERMIHRSLQRTYLCLWKTSSTTTTTSSTICCTPTTKTAPRTAVRFGPWLRPHCLWWTLGTNTRRSLPRTIHEGQQQPAVSTTEQASKALVATSNRHTLDLPGLQSYFWRKGLCLLPKSVVFLSSWCQENGADKDRDGSSSGSRHRCPSLPDLSEISCLVDEAIAGAEALIQLGIWIGEDAFFFREIASQLEHRFDLKFRGTTSSMQACLGSGPWKTENGPCSDVGDNDYDNKIPELLGLLILGMETINDPHSVEQPDCWEMDLPVVYSITKMLIAIRKDKKHGGHNLLNPVSVEHRRGQGHRGQ